MDRSTWLAQRQAAVVATYDAGALSFDREPYPAQEQERWVAMLLGLVPAGGSVLDAPCGTGRYFPMIAAAGLSVTGVDQSAGMLAQARSRGIAAWLEQSRLQDLSYTEAFDASVTIDAMENVPPEDWPVVIANLRRAVRPGGVLYLTVEVVDRADIDQAYESLTAQGQPAVHGEITEGDVAGYHYYPGRDQAADWLTGAGLEIVDEEYSQYDGWGYHHFLLRRPWAERFEAES
jgi:cyclopropane fatty-acyl-phospholipid synthase-like methyltransferase